MQEPAVLHSDKRSRSLSFHTIKSENRLNLNHLPVGAGCHHDCHPALTRDLQAVRNVARNGRAVLVTIHQPSIEIFEVRVHVR
jgi:hypothetical protein